MEPLLTPSKDVNKQRIEATRQTKATVKTNNKSQELPLLITKATTSPLIGLDWMQLLGIQINAKNSETQMHNSKMGDTEKRT